MRLVLAKGRKGYSWFCDEPPPPTLEVVGAWTVKVEGDEGRFISLLKRCNPGTLELFAEDVEEWCKSTGISSIEAPRLESALSALWENIVEEAIERVRSKGIEVLP